jgi:vacuolar protein sorting-associated protein 72
MLKTKEKCAITGLPAKYRDPVTGLPYANLEAFKIIREQHTSKDSAALAVQRQGESSQSATTVLTTDGANSEPSVRDIQTSAVAGGMIESSESGVVTPEQLSRLGNRGLRLF